MMNRLRKIINDAIEREAYRRFGKDWRNANQRLADENRELRNIIRIVCDHSDPQPFDRMKKKATDKQIKLLVRILDHGY